MPEKSRRAKLFSKMGETRGAEFEIAGEATIGRNPENTIVLGPSLVSSRHARIRYDPEQESFVLEDLGSLNGTAVDGHAVTGSERLGHLHVITFAGKHDFIFQDLDRSAGRHRQRSAAPAAAPAPPRASTSGDEEGPPKEVTGVEDAVAVMPSFLAERSERAGAPPLEVTGIEKAPAMMPSFLAGRNEPDSSAEPGPSAESGPPDDATLLEKRVMTIPEVLAGRDAAAESQPVETLELEDVDLPSASELLADDEPPAGVLELMAGSADKATYCLEFAAAGGGFRNVELVDGDNVIGRGADARIKPDSLDISRHHAVLTVAAGSVTVRDLGSRNHTFVQDQRIDGEVEIEVGARLRFGGVEARLTVAEKG